MFGRNGGFGWARVSILAGALYFTAACQAALKLELVATGVSRPVFVTAPPGDTNRIFILEQHTGRIRIFSLQSNVFTSTFLTVPNLATGNEQGLLGLAFHPNYRSNGFFYVNITSSTGGRTEVIRYTAIGAPESATTADRATAKLILTFPQPESNHNGGWTAFGPDGYLYISTGDGGGGNDQHGSFGNAQNRAVLLGKILRIDVDNGDPYNIPDGNPFKANMSFANEIWAFGLRNPWRCSFDRDTGNLWIGDVGQGAREEIDLDPAGVGGLNFGWRPREGTIQTPGISSTEKPITDPVGPVFEYDHGKGVSITGGYVYRGSAVPELRGKYIFADYGSARFWLTTPDGTNGTTVEITSEINPSSAVATQITSFGEDAQGELYVCSMGKSSIFRIVADLPKLTAAKIDEGTFKISFSASANSGYSLEAKSPLLGGDWAAVTNIASAASARTVTLTNAVTESEQYFRLRQQ